MGESSQTQKTQSSSTTNPWGPAQDALKGAIPEIQSQYQADKGGNLVPQAQGYLSQAISGDFLDPSSNPHLGALTKAVTDPIQASLSAQFGRSGRGNSGDAARYISQGMTSGLAAPLFNQYNVERGFQQGAAQMAPAMDAASSLPLDQYLERLRGVGSMGSESTSNSTSKMTQTPSMGQTIGGIGMTALGLMSGNPMMALGGGSGLAQGLMGGGFSDPSALTGNYAAGLPWAPNGGLPPWQTSVSYG